MSASSREGRTCTVKRSALRRIARGAVMTEYSVLVGSVALGASVALVGLGVALVNSFEHVRGFILYPFP